MSATESNPAEHRIVRCQHCERDIEPLPSGYWMDSDGFMICKKRVRHETFMTHQPMPTYDEALGWVASEHTDLLDTATAYWKNHPPQ